MKFWQMDTGKSAMEKKDKLIGEALVKSARNKSADEDCPSLADIAALFEKKLAGDERDSMMGHIANCDSCYQTFNKMHDWKKAEKEKRRKKWNYVYAAVAAVAMILVVIKINIQQPQSPVSVNQGDSATQVSAAKIADLLFAQGLDKNKFLNETQSKYAANYSFTGGLTPEKKYFRIGVKTVDVEAAIRANDRQRTIININEIKDLFQGNAPATDFLSKTARDIEKGTALKQFAGFTTELAGFAKTKDEKFYLRFGQWVEGGRLSAIFGKDKFFNSKDLAYFKNGLAGKEIPPGLQGALEEIGGAIKATNLSKKEFRRLATSFSDISVFF